MNDDLIVVCVPTYRRLRLLRNCLTAISKLNKPDNHQIQIAVVDNDQEETAKALCAEMASELTYPLHYFVQAERGLSSVRNRLLEEAISLDAKLIAFIDDDEQPELAWLVMHIDSMNKYSADVCSGPVRPFGLDPGSQKKKAKVTGSRPRHVSTNNVLLKTKLITMQGLHFDPFYNFIGGEDFDFFERSSKLGNTHVWVEEALVFETIAKERNSLRYLFYRHYSGGINSIMRYKRTNPAWRAWIRFLPKIIGKFLGAIAYSVLSCIKLDKALFFTAVKKLANGLGYLAGLLNVVVERYRHIDSEEDLSKMP
jgi:succinoglycan biosynthesis protein ExoM